jgi:hypothetical protein
MIAECQRDNAEPRRQRDRALARRGSDYADRLTARFVTGDRLPLLWVASYRSRFTGPEMPVL